MRSLSKSQGARQQAKQSLAEMRRTQSPLQLWARSPLWVRSRRPSRSMLPTRMLPLATIVVMLVSALGPPATAQSSLGWGNRDMPLAIAGEVEVPMMTVSRPSVFQIPRPSELVLDSGELVLGTADELQVDAPPSAEGFDARDVACLAARNWPPAAQLRQHAKSLEDVYCEERDECTRQAAKVIADLLRQQAARQQDIGAATAMKVYYSLVAAKLRRGLLAESDAMLQARLEQQDKLMHQGLAAAVDLTLFEREKLALSQRSLELEQTIAQLSQALNELCRSNHDWSNVSLEPLEVRTSELDLEYLQQLALTQRFDLVALQSIADQVSTGTAPVFANMLGGVTGMASLPLPKLCMLDRLLRRQSYPGLVQNLRKELKIASESLAASVRQSVFEKSTELKLDYQQLALEEQVVDSWSTRLAQLSRLAELGESRPSDMAEVESSLLAAQAKVLERRLAAKLAEVELAEAVGGLHRRSCHGQAWLITTSQISENIRF